MGHEEMKKAAKKIIFEGVKAADPEILVRDNIEVKDDKIDICGKTFSRDDYEEVVVLGIGKASVPMASACKILDPDDGLVITDDREASSNGLDVKAASHPYPEKINEEVSKELLSKVRQKNNSLFIFLVSGGGSALFFSPVEGITLSEMNDLNRALVRSGADIHEINSVRKHLSKVKGGFLGKELSERGDAVSLIISDVVGDEMSSIASGPTTSDATTFDDAKSVLERYDLWKDVSENIRGHIEDGITGKVEETPTSIDVQNFLVGGNMTALRAAEKAARKHDFDPMILTSKNTGEAEVVAKPYMGIAKEIQDSNVPIEPPAALIFGGEMTVKLSSDQEGGRGGPNREFVLSAAIEIKDRKDIVVASIDTDGTDGMGKAGAVADTESVERSALDPVKLLKKHDSERFFDQLDSSIEIDSSTNVNDISVVLIS